jgi:hypothetical protein
VEDFADAFFVSGKRKPKTRGACYTPCCTSKTSINRELLKQGALFMRIPTLWRGPLVFAAVVCLGTGQTYLTTDSTQEANIKAYVDLIRKDVKKEKTSIVTELMALSPEEAAKFWPIYNQYDKALTALADERVELIKMYADNFGTMTDEMATKLGLGVLDLEAKRNQLKRQYFQKMSQGLSPLIAARFLQIDNQLEKILDLQIAASLPIVE